ncbi:hypothetical protein [Novosphingobium sp. BL-8A]|uniref:hypothetical protein n=1 Tax=Novosphingobium sp. BL-8A TaxID=3127639 RepID=UPI003756A8C5
MAVHSISGNLLDGLGVFAARGYQRLLAVDRHSPIAADVGSADQWSGAIGMEYTFDEAPLAGISRVLPDALRDALSRAGGMP